MKEEEKEQEKRKPRRKEKGYKIEKNVYSEKKKKEKKIF